MLSRCRDKETEQKDGFAGVVWVRDLPLGEETLFALQPHVPAQPNPHYRRRRFCFDRLDSQIHHQVSLEVPLVLPDNSGR